jgi:hypothetical protein
LRAGSATVCYRQLERVEGLCDHWGPQVSVAGRLAANGRVAVLVHELAHALVGREAGLAKQLEELVVEAVVFCPRRHEARLGHWARRH